MPDRPSFEHGLGVSMTTGAANSLEIFVDQYVETTFDLEEPKLLRVVSLKRSGPLLTITLANTDSMLSPSSPSPQTASPETDGSQEAKPRDFYGQPTARPTTST